MGGRRSSPGKQAVHVKETQVEEECSYVDESERAEVSVQLQESAFALVQRASLLLVVLLVAGGLSMFIYRSTQFNTQGFMLVLCSSFLGSVRWTWTHIFMQKAGLGLPLSVSEKLFHFHKAGVLFSLVGKLFLGGILAFALGFSEFLLISRTSSLTLSIAGIFKEICILFLAVHFLRDCLSLLNWPGFAVCLSGISFHVILKAINSKGDKALKLHKEAISDPDLELWLHHTKQAEEKEEEDDERPQQDLKVKHKGSCSVLARPA